MVFETTRSFHLFFVVVVSPGRPRWRAAVANTLEVRVDVRPVLDRLVHPVEHRLGAAHAHDADSHLSEPDVRLEPAKGTRHTSKITLRTAR